MTVKHLDGLLGVIAGSVSLEVLQKQVENISQERRWVAHVELIHSWGGAVDLMTSKGTFQDYFSGVNVFSITK